MTDGDWVLIIITVGALAIGLVSMLVGKLVEWYDRMAPAFRRRYAVSSVSVKPEPAPPADAQTDRQTDAGLSALSAAVARMRVDRTRAAIIDTLVLLEWDVDQIRNAVKGDTGVIGEQIKEAKQRLGIIETPRMLNVRDEKGARTIPFEEARRA